MAASPQRLARTLGGRSRIELIGAIDRPQGCSVGHAVDKGPGILVSPLEVRAQHLPSQILAAALLDDHMQVRFAFHGRDLLIVFLEPSTGFGIVWNSVALSNEFPPLIYRRS
jgi:hypothetical protein